MGKFYSSVLCILLLAILASCSLKTQENQDIKRDSNGLIVPNADGSIPVQKDRQGLVSDTNPKSSTENDVSIKSNDWISLNKKNHPDWYVCAQDSDCVTAQAECGSNCASNSINSKAYSDYVVEFSKFCEGSGRTIKKCPYTKKSCSSGVCKIEYI